MKYRFLLVAFGFSLLAVPSAHAATTFVYTTETYYHGLPSGYQPYRPHHHRKQCHRGLRAQRWAPQYNSYYPLPVRYETPFYPVHYHPQPRRVVRHYYRY